METLQGDKNVAESAKDNVKHDKEVMDQFCELSADFEDLSKEEKVSVLLELMETVVNATFSDKIRSFRQEFTTRGGLIKDDNANLRQRLDVTSGKAAKRLKKKEVSATEGEWTSECAEVREETGNEENEVAKCLLMMKNYI